MNAVAAYLNDVLVPQQRKYKVSETFLLYGSAPSSTHSSDTGRTTVSAIRFF